MIKVRKAGMRKIFLLIICIITSGLFTIAVQARPLIIGSKSFTEQNILSAITVLYLTKQGFQVQPRTNLSAVILRNAMLNRQIDITWEYTGTSLIIFHHITQPLSHKQAYETVKQLDARLGLVWLNPSKINNTYAFAMRRTRAQQENIYNVSQMVAKIDQLRQQHPQHNWSLGLDMEFARRRDGLVPFQKAYHLTLTREQIRQMASGLVYNAIRDGFVDAGLVYTTDGRIQGFDLLVLQDDKNFFPGYAATPVVSAQILARSPGLAQALNTLSAHLNQQNITELNAKVDIEYQTPQQVAYAFLKAHGLL